MSGIAGMVLDGPNQSVDRGVPKQMTRSLPHHGPDGEGYLVKGNVGFGHQRLSIIALQGSAQPMHADDDDDATVLVYNGELYNYLDLKQTLTSAGHVFEMDSDSQVILNAHLQWRVKRLGRFNGMWSIALWGGRKRQLFCARDRLGEKPFYYSHNRNGLFFGSQFKAHWQAGVERQTNVEMLDTLLALTYLPAPNTTYKNVFKLEAPLSQWFKDDAQAHYRHATTSFQQEELFCSKGLDSVLDTTESAPIRLWTLAMMSSSSKYAGGI